MHVSSVVKNIFTSVNSVQRFWILLNVLQCYLYQNSNTGRHWCANNKNFYPCCLHRIMPRPTCPVLANSTNIIFLHRPIILWYLTRFSRDVPSSNTITNCRASGDGYPYLSWRRSSGRPGNFYPGLQFDHHAKSGCCVRAYVLCRRRRPKNLGALTTGAPYLGIAIVHDI